MRGWTKNDIDVLRAMTLDGEDVVDVVAAIGMPVDSVRMRLSWLRESGDLPDAGRIVPKARRLTAPASTRRPTRPAPYFWTVEREEAFVRMRAERVPDDRIAEALGVTLGALKCKAKLMRKAGVEVAKKVRPPEEMADSLVRMRRVGVPEAVIAETLGIGRKALGSRVKRLRRRGYRVQAAMNHYRPEGVDVTR